jgi:hypothetical protein
MTRTHTPPPHSGPATGPPGRAGPMDGPHPAPAPLWARDPAPSRLPPGAVIPTCPHSYSTVLAPLAHSARTGRRDPRIAGPPGPGLVSARVFRHLPQVSGGLEIYDRNVIKVVIQHHTRPSQPLTRGGEQTQKPSI